jgi:hypothetical protein
MKSRTFVVLIAKRSLPHVRKLDSALRASVHEPIAACWVEFGRRDYLRKFLHICWFNIDNVKTLVLDVQVPQVDS